MISVPLLAVITGSVLAGVVLIVFVVVVWRLCTLKSRRRSSSYEQIVSKHREHSKVDLGGIPTGITA